MECKVKKEKEYDLSFPVIKKKPLPNSLRSIDEINEWIEHDYELFFDRKLYEKKKKKYSVNKPFVL
jgi:hypothetical protein